jgi:CheY-like chemotaxis protein
MEEARIDHERKKILIVDDNAPLRKITRKILENAGYDVLEAPDGATAVTVMIKEKPDMVLQDLVLPDITGYDLVIKLRAKSENPLLPILAYTSFLEKQDAPWDTSEGFNALLVKPLQAADLLEAVKIHLSKTS